MILALTTHPLPWPMWILGAIAVVMVAWGGPAYIRESNRNARAHAAQHSTPEESTMPTHARHYCEIVDRARARVPYVPTHRADDAAAQAA